MLRDANSVAQQRGVSLEKVYNLQKYCYYLNRYGEMMDNDIELHLKYK